MTKIIAIANHKGGVGKTATAVSLSSIFAGQGRKVLLIDFDPQGNASAWLHARGGGGNLLAALAAEADLVVEDTSFAGLQLVAGGLPLASAQKVLDTETGAEHLLRELLQRSAGSWDMIFLDCPPGLGFLTVNALAASTDILLPLEAHPLGLRGVNDSRKVINAVQQRLNPATKITGVLPCRAHLRRTLHREVMVALESAFPGHVAPPVRENVALAEAPAHGLPINHYSPRSHGSNDYRNVARWLSRQMTKEEV
ncbi:MAG: ParA family protein [Desulfuromonadales bacterium]|nr:ParA family protein [Desulfuromonadales bacterium]